MNKSRRRELDQAINLMNKAKEIIESCSQDEQEGFDNLPEGLQMSERGEAMEASVSNMDEAVSQIDEAINEIELSQE